MIFTRLMKMAIPALALAALAISPANAADTAQQPAKGGKYTQNEIVKAGADFFGITSEAMAKGCNVYSTNRVYPTPISKATKAQAPLLWACAMARAG